jgi:tRNA(Ile)-lysidine synthase
MLHDFLKYIEDNSMISQGESILLGVSGGIDSMVMADLFIKSGMETGIAHCNFCLRAKESDMDEDLVKQLALNNKIPFYSKRFYTKAHAEKNGISVQMAARNLRYEWFERTAKEYGFNKIAVAHNLNDNIETLLINLTRGTGITGLTGMKPVNGNIIRPLLFATRDAITKYADTCGITYREDKSNAETKYSRNKIRHLVIPVLRDINPSIDRTLTETAERFTGIEEIVSLFTEDLREKLITQNDNDIVFNISLLQCYLHNHAIIFELFKQFGITSAMVKDIVTVINGNTGSRIITDKYRIIKNRDELIVSEEGQKKGIFYKVNDTSGFLKIREIISAKKVSIDESFRIPEDPFTGCFDSEKINFPVIIRNWRAGDYFYPLGMKQKKKLSDYFIDNKYSLPEKEKTLVMESGGNIVWIIGGRIDNRFRITESTRTVLIIKVKS